MNMKNIFTFSKVVLVLALLFSANQAFSKIITVSNNTAIAAQYNNLAAAFAAGNAGDTFYIHGSNTSYGDITLKQRFVIIGPGYGPTNPTGLKAQLGYVYLDTLTGVSGTSGTYIAGLTLYQIQPTSNYNGRVLNNITLRRNYFTGYIYIGYSTTEVHNWVITENLAYSISYAINTATSTNILITNNILSYFYNAYKSILSNNVIYYSTVFSECSVSNNIFVYSSGNNSSVNSTFNNNLFSSAQTFTSGTNTFSPAGQATTNSDPQFTGGTGTTWLSISDYHLSVSSSGHLAGTDGKDLGVYGGTGFVWGGTPPVPMIYFYNLKPNYVQANGTLNVSVSVKNQ
jgi:hypothetical protein